MANIAVNPAKIDWNGEDSVLLCNPAWPQPWRERMMQIHLPDDVGIVWLASSGSTSADSRKIIGLSKQAIRHSAIQVNQWIDSDAHDCWLNPLPGFHIGGLSTYMRAALSGARVVTLRQGWNTTLFSRLLVEHQVTLTSLVPTQLFDLVTQNILAPAQLRAVFVGGGVLSEQLYSKARALGWPVLPTYGMTECASQVATACLSSIRQQHYPALLALPHVALAVDEAQRLWIKSKAAYRYLIDVSLHDVVVSEHPEEAFFQTDDCARLDGKELILLGRAGQTYKVLGERVNINELNRILENMGLPIKACIVARKHERKEHEIGMVVEKQSEPLAAQWAKQFDASVAPYEKIMFIKVVEEIPRTELGKIKWGKLLSMIEDCEQ